MNVFRWSDEQEGEATLRSLMAPLLDEQVIQAFLNQPPDMIVSDDLSWLEKVVKKAHGKKCGNLHELLAHQLRTHYHAVVAFHGCRPITTESYQKQGILPSNPERLRNAARELFGNSASVLEAIDHLAQREFGSSYEEHNAGRCYFELSYDHLVNSCGHYLLYGSEYLLCIANSIGKAQILRNRGRAVVIECMISSSELPSWFFKELAGNMVERMFTRLLDPSCEAEELNFGFSIKNKVPPENIIQFHYPTKIPNPHNRMIRED
ncbi:MAG: hypothetical protein ACKVY0_06175 [Prosthecobacter sp.]|uniref:hypothetical protein n=1 Tax=Prosthecobacter sp. TaxID=1965333 RepID=UPI0039016FBC